MNTIPKLSIVAPFDHQQFILDMLHTSISGKNALIEDLTRRDAVKWAKWIARMEEELVLIRLAILQYEEDIRQF